MQTGPKSQVETSNFSPNIEGSVYAVTGRIIVRQTYIGMHLSFMLNASVPLMCDLQSKDLWMIPIILWPNNIGQELRTSTNPNWY